MRESLSPGIETIQYLVASYPQQAGSILEQRGNPGAGEAVAPQWIVHEHLELITVIAVEAVLGSKPDEAFIGIRSFSLRAQVT